MSDLFMLVNCILSAQPVMLLLAIFFVLSMALLVWVSRRPFE